jgi:hypothetical protein
MLDLRKHSLLEGILANFNQLLSLLLDKNEMLHTIEVEDNKITWINLFNVVKLAHLNCAYNGITNLSLGTNKLLQTLFCKGNLLTSLNTSHLINIRTIDCSRNNITELDFSNCKELEYIDCYFNKLYILNIKNGNNRKIKYFDTRVNLQSLCIQVDDSTLSYDYSGWFKDYNAIFSEDCSLVSVDEETNLGKDITISPNPAGDYVEINNVILRSEATKDPVILYDLLGSKLMDSRLRGNDIFVSEEGNVRIDISSLSPGVYFVRIGSYFAKFVKM